MLLLQAAAFLPLFRGVVAARSSEPVASRRLDEMAPVDGASGEEGLVEIFALVSQDRAAAAARALAWLNSGGDPAQLVTAARRLVFRKGDDSHDYKFSSAVFEDYLDASPGIRNSYLASSLFLLRGSEERDNRLTERIRGALA
jgi:hypothetical protein